MPTKVSVRNLSDRTSKKELAGLISEAGPIVEINMAADSNTKGSAVVEFSSRSAADKCVKLFNNYELQGRRMKVVLLGK